MRATHEVPSLLLISLRSLREEMRFCMRLRPARSFRVHDDVRRYMSHRRT